MIEFKRGRRDQTDVADRMTWESRCGRFRVQECKSRLQKKTYYHALINQGGWRLIDHMKTYRTRKAAEKACAQAADDKPKRSRKGGSTRATSRKKATGKRVVKGATRKR